MVVGAEKVAMTAARTCALSTCRAVDLESQELQVGRGHWIENQLERSNAALSGF